MRRQSLVFLASRLNDEHRRGFSCPHPALRKITRDPGNDLLLNPHVSLRNYVNDH